MDFVSDGLADGRSFRSLTVVYQFTREYAGLEADHSMTGMKVAQALERAKQERGGVPESITVDDGTEFCSRALEVWPMGQNVQLRSSRLSENDFSTARGGGAGEEVRVDRPEVDSGGMSERIHYPAIRCGWSLRANCLSASSGTRTRAPILRIGRIPFAMR